MCLVARRVTKREGENKNTKGEQKDTDMDLWC